MDKILNDFKGHIINQNDIVKVENSITNETKYYLYSKVNNVPYLLKYDNNGNLNQESFGNVKIDIAVNLINDNVWKWTIMGNKDQIWETIFK